MFNEIVFDEFYETIELATLFETQEITDLLMTGAGLPFTFAYSS